VTRQKDRANLHDKTVKFVMGYIVTTGRYETTANGKEMNSQAVGGLSVDKPDAKIQVLSPKAKIDCSTGVEKEGCM
jgi:hypothetical protein